MFKAKQALGDKLPRTGDSFMPALERDNFQALVWDGPKPAGVWQREYLLLSRVKSHVPHIPYWNR